MIVSNVIYFKGSWKEIGSKTSDVVIVQRYICKYKPQCLCYWNKNKLFILGTNS